LILLLSLTFATVPLLPVSAMSLHDMPRQACSAHLQDMGAILAQANTWSADPVWAQQFMQAAIAVKAENVCLQEHVRWLEASLKQAMLEIQTLKDHGEVPLLDPHPLSGYAHSTPSTSASSSPAGTRSLDKLVGLLDTDIGIRPADQSVGLIFENGLPMPPGLSLPPPGLTRPLTPLGVDQGVKNYVVQNFTPSPVPSPVHQDTAVQATVPTCIGLEDGRQTATELDNVPRSLLQTVEWRIENVSAKLRTSCGFPLISSAYAVGSVTDLRFLFVPGDKWMTSARERKQKGRPARGVTAAPSGPANGALKLKVGQPEQAMALNFKLYVGGSEQGPVICDFSEMGVQGVDLDFDWMKRVDNQGCLSIRFEFL